MCKLMEDRVNETAREAKYEKTLEFATALLKDGEMSLKKIAKLTGLILEEVEELAEQIKANA